eukprot:13845776-Alexandrium_andersonii.AAC.1
MLWAFWPGGLPFGPRLHALKYDHDTTERWQHLPTNRTAVAKTLATGRAGRAPCDQRQPARRMRRNESTNSLANAVCTCQ